MPRQRPRVRRFRRTVAHDDQVQINVYQRVSSKRAYEWARHEIPMDIMALQNPGEYIIWCADDNNFDSAVLVYWDGKTVTER